MSEQTPWHGRIDRDDGAKALRWHQCVHPAPAEQAQSGFSLLGFCCDTGVRRNGGRPGAAKGPDAIRRALAPMAWHAALPVYDAGDIPCHGDQLEDAQRRLGERVGELIGRQQLPILLGGGHEIAYGSWLGLQQALPEARIGIINFDAHLDLRSPVQGASSGTPFFQIAEHCARLGRPFHYACLGVAEQSNTQALFSRAQSLGAWIKQDWEISAQSVEIVAEQLRAFIEPLDAIQLSIDLDLLPAAVAPGVSAPAPRGVELSLLERLLSTLLQSGKLRLVELAELNPDFDRDQQTARVAARLIHFLTR